MKRAMTLLLLCLSPLIARGDDAIPSSWIGYTEGRNDLLEGPFANRVTNRACVVKADGTQQRIVAEELTRNWRKWSKPTHSAPKYPFSTIDTE